MWNRKSWTAPRGFAATVCATAPRGFAAAVAGLAVLVVAQSLSAQPTEIKPPKALDDRLIVELVASEPELVTPTGVAVDKLGRVWALENNSHFRPNNYKGHPSDRVRVFDDFAPDGRARRVRTFADGFRDGMGLAFAATGELLIATRAEIFALAADTPDGPATRRRSLIRLLTAGQYPHNGLSGFAFDPQGRLIFGMGENLGADYRLVGADGAVIPGGGEGGNLFRCRLDGTGLTRLATGFWNPFHHVVDGLGRLWVVDNDPDSRPPCRLLHVVPNGDYGFRFRNGRKGVHPFTAWNGELPGTLPMTAGTAEAPSGIVAYEAAGLPAEYRGRLFVTSWGDHVIEQFTPVARGASWSAKPEVLVRGGGDFRPVGIAVAPDGSLLVTDWVDKSYPLHGKGRLWRIRAKTNPVGQIPPALPAEPIRTALAALWASEARPLDVAGRAELERLIADSPDAVRAEAVRVLAERAGLEAGVPERLLTLAERDGSPLVRAAAMRGLRESAAAEKLLDWATDPDPFLSQAAREGLARSAEPTWLRKQTANAKPAARLAALLVLRRLGTPESRATAGTFLADADPTVRRAAVQWIGEERLTEYADSLTETATRGPVTRELVEALLAAQEFLSARAGKEASGDDLLARLLLDEKSPTPLRAMALRMLPVGEKRITLALLDRLARSGDAELSREAIRTLAARADEPSRTALRRWVAESATEKPNADSLRAEGVLGLAESADSPASRTVLVELLAGKSDLLCREAVRSLRGQSDADTIAALRTLAQGQVLKSEPYPERAELAAQLLLAVPVGEADLRAKLASVAGQRPTDVAGWKALAAQAEKLGDAAAGARVFAHAKGGRCVACHRVQGRGGAVGPDLSGVARSMDLNKLAESILEPSREMSPQFVPWAVQLTDGRVLTGVILAEDSTSVTLADAEGRHHKLPLTEIEERRAQKLSLMPEKLTDQMTRQEWLDLLAYLRTLR